MRQLHASRARSEVRGKYSQPGPWRAIVDAPLDVTEGNSVPATLIHTIRYRCSVLAGLAVLVVLASCATQPAVTAYDPPGFLSGLLHGFLIFFSLVASIFTEHRIYAFPNSGGWYDFGFFLGASSFLGGSGAGAG